MISSEKRKGCVERWGGSKEVGVCDVIHCLLRSMHFCSGESSTRGGDEGGREDGDDEEDGDEDEDDSDSEDESSDLSLPPSCSILKPVET